MPRHVIDLPEGWELYDVCVRKYDAGDRSKYYAAGITVAEYGFRYATAHRVGGTEADFQPLGGCSDTLPEAISACDEHARARAGAGAGAAAGPTNIDANGGEVVL